jgi:hypothetical protein
MRALLLVSLTPPWLGSWDKIYSPWSCCKLYYAFTANMPFHTESINEKTSGLFTQAIHTTMYLWDSSSKHGLHPKKNLKHAGPGHGLITLVECKRGILDWKHFIWFLKFAWGGLQMNESQWRKGWKIIKMYSGGVWKSSFFLHLLLLILLPFKLPTNWLQLPLYSTLTYCKFVVIIMVKYKWYTTHIVLNILTIIIYFTSVRNLVKLEYIEVWVILHGSRIHFRDIIYVFKVTLYGSKVCAYMLSDTKLVNWCYF